MADLRRKVACAWLATAAIGLGGCASEDDSGSESTESGDDGGDTSGESGTDDGSGGGGTESTGSGGDSSGEDPLVSFEDSGCKSGQHDDAGPATRPRGDTSAYDGLQCFVWETLEDDTLAITLTNFHDSCGVPWAGSVAVDDTGVVELQVTNEICAEADCGWCIYDWSFELRGMTPADELAVRAERAGCPGDPFETVAEITLPIGDAAAGARCRYANWDALGQHAGEAGLCGHELMPCTSAEAQGWCWTDQQVPPCVDDLECDADTDLCHQPCTIDDDCPLPGTLSCQTDLCRPVDPW